MAHAFLLNLNVTGAVFDAAFAELMQLKIDAQAGIEDIDARRKAIAAWANFVDDVIRALQREVFDHEARLDVVEGVVSGGLGLDIGEVDNNPSLTGVTRVQFDQSDGFTVTDDGGGHARVDLVSAAPVAIGTTLSAGSAASVAKSDHVHIVTAAAVRLARVEYEVDFSSLANNTFANGTESIDGKNWTVGAQAASQQYDISNGNGMRWRVANTTTATFTTVAQTSSHIYIDLATLIGPNYDAAARYVFELYFSSKTLVAAEQTRILFGLWTIAGVPTAAATSLRAVGYLVAGATAQPYTATDSSESNGTEDITANTTLGMMAGEQGNHYLYAGTWSSGWPAYMNCARLVAASVAAGSPFARGDTRFVISAKTTSAVTGLSAFTIAALRARRA